MDRILPAQPIFLNDLVGTFAAWSGMRRTHLLKADDVEEPMRIDAD